MNKHTGIYIPGRLSSERLPRKLVLPMSDACLFEIACRKLNELPKDINKYTLVYDKELVDIAGRYENIIVIHRSRESAKAEGPLSYIFEGMKMASDTHLMFLNPCLAFLSQETILKSIKAFNDSEADYATSVKPFQNWLIGKDGKVLNEMNYKELTTKKIEPVWQAAHCFHIFNREQFFQDGYMLKDGFLPLPVPVEETIDVDTMEEYEYARWKYETDLRNRY